jgi:hypothetical protein
LSSITHGTTMFPHSSSIQHNSHVQDHPNILIAQWFSGPARQLIRMFATDDSVEHRRRLSQIVLFGIVLLSPPAKRCAQFNPRTTEHPFSSKRRRLHMGLNPISAEAVSSWRRSSIVERNGNSSSLSSSLASYQRSHFWQRCECSGLLSVLTA